jgi:hypothetical protein
VRIETSDAGLVQAVHASCGTRSQSIALATVWMGSADRLNNESTVQYGPDGSLTLYFAERF